MTRSLRRILKIAAPRFALRAWRQVAHGLVWGGRSNAEVFSRVYARQVWGGTAQDPYHSGAGSRDAAIVGPYVAATGRWLTTVEAVLGRKPDLADIGCGDFYVGAQLRPFCADYIACDVVPELIAHHRGGPHHGDVSFRVLDIALEPAPQVDVICLRQVLQHLGNADIAAALGHIKGRARWLVVSEHLPAGRFVPNQPKPPGPVTRLDQGSGVDLSAPPFALPYLACEVLCDVPETESGGRVVTTLYTLQAR